MRGLPALSATDRMLQALGELAIARGAALDELNTPVYSKALLDVEPGLLERACFALGREPRRDYEPALPTVGDILERVREIGRADAEVARAANLLPAPKSDEDGPRVFCVDCQDESSGWRTLRCGGVGRHERRVEASGRDVHLPMESCGRRQEHAAHTFTVRCHCWQRNPEVDRRKQRQALKRSA